MFQVLRVGKRDVFVALALDRSVEVIKGEALDPVHNLRAHAAIGPSVIGDHRAVGPTDALQNGSFVQGTEGSQVDDLRIDRALSLDDPSSLAWDGLMADLYRGHPWGRPVEGTPASLERISLGALCCTVMRQ